MNSKETLLKKLEAKRNPWSWVSTLYFAEGLPYTVVTFLSIVMYKRLGISNTDIALYTSWLYLPWVIKPLWSPIVDVLGMKRNWIIGMQLVIGGAMAGVGLTIPIPDFFQFTLIFFWLIAFTSATHDIAADGFYMLALKESQQSFFVGIRSTFYKVAMVFGQGLLVILAGQLETALTVSPAEFQVVSSPNKFFKETIKVDSKTAKELPGALRLVVDTSFIEISTKPKTREQVNFYTDFAKSFNIMNGFSKDKLGVPDTSGAQDLVGNIGIAKFSLSKKPSEGSEYAINVDFLEGQSGIKVIEGKTLRFTSANWNKPAFTVFQLDSNISKKTTAVFKARMDRVPLAWTFTFIIIAGLFIVFFIYHRFILPYPSTDVAAGSKRTSSPLKEFFRSFARFFEKKKIFVILLFILFYRFGEAQLVKISSPFMLDGKDVGGLGLSTSQVGLIYGVFGTIALMIGGILGGFLVSKKGLKYWLWPMLIAINVPDLVYVYMSWIQPSSFWIIGLCVTIESFGYGFGFTFYMMYLIYISQGEYKTSHYALATGFMALGMMIPGMFSGMIQEAIGYKFFFIWVVIATVPGFIIAKFIPLEYGFGKKKLTEE